MGLDFEVLEYYNMEKPERKLVIRREMIMTTMAIRETEKKTRAKKATKPKPANVKRVEMVAESSYPKLKYEIGVRTQRLCDPFVLATAPNLNKLLGVEIYGTAGFLLGNLVGDCFNVVTQDYWRESGERLTDIERMRRSADRLVTHVYVQGCWTRMKNVLGSISKLERPVLKWKELSEGVEKLAISKPKKYEDPVVQKYHFVVEMPKDEGVKEILYRAFYSGAYIETFKNPEVRERMLMEYRLGHKLPKDWKPTWRELEAEETAVEA